MTRPGGLEFRLQAARLPRKRGTPNGGSVKMRPKHAFAVR